MSRKLLILPDTIFFALWIFFLNACNPVDRNSSHPEVTNKSILRGKALAAIYCKTCHVLPDPSLLNATTWEDRVMPAMGPHLGIFEFKYRRYPSSRGDVHLAPGYYPSAAVISIDQWEDLVNYYMATSPDSLYASQLPSNIVTDSLPYFQVIKPAFNYLHPAVGYIKFQPLDSSHSIIASDIVKHRLYFFDKKLQVQDSITSTGPVVNIDFKNKQLLLCDIGGLAPTNGKFGSAILSSPGARLLPSRDSVLIGKLARPVQITAADLNRDGIMDYVVCEFGYLSGKFSWMEGLKSGGLKQHVLNSLPGAIRAYITDFNHDGLPDIWVLMAHAEEGVFLYENKGAGVFQQQEVLRFPPSYGSSSFELDDFNKDGFADILYTCGDNADYSPILKPYHGVYIFLNNGHNQFEQKYFFPMNGCYKAIAGDFNKDGQLDIAAISFFADYRKETGFIFLKQVAPLDFKPYTSKLVNTGRWLTMDAGDIDGDGRLDLLLGNCSLGPPTVPSSVDWTQGPPFLVLKNISGED